VINGRVVVENGEVITVDMDPVIEAQNHFSREAFREALMSAEVPQ